MRIEGDYSVTFSNVQNNDILEGIRGDDLLPKYNNL